MIDLKNDTHSWSQLFNSENTFLLEELMSYHSFYSNCLRRAKALNLDHSKIISININNTYEDLELLFALWMCKKTVVLHSSLTPVHERKEKDQLLGAKLLSEIYKKEEVVEDSISLNQVACYIFTSGSTSRPKAIPLSFKNLFFSANNFNQHYKVKEDQFLPITLPLYHVGGLLIALRSLLEKSHTQVLTPGKLKSDHFTKSPDFLSVVPLQMDRILEDTKELKFFKNTSFILGGAKASIKTLKALEKNKLLTSTTYGMTETSAMCMATELTTELEVLKTVGKPFAGIKVSISADKKISITGDCVTPLFLNHTIATNDLASVQNNGNYEIHGRADSTFISGGENINPQEIEDTLNILGIIRPSIVGVKDEVLQKKAVLFHQTDKDELEVREICRKNLHPHKIPKHIFPYPEFSLSGIKVKKALLEDLAQHYIQLEKSKEFFPLTYAGDPRNSWIVFIHGFMGRKEDWSEVFSELARDFFVIGIDCPGHGENNIKEPFSLADFQSDFKKFSDCLEHDFSLVGYSQGGRLALGITLLELPQITSLILESASAGIEDEMEKERRYKSDQTMFKNIHSTSALASFLEYWYKNSIFGELSNHKNFNKVIESKLNHDPFQWQQALNTFSVGRQENYRAHMKKIGHIPKMTIIGALDHKYLAQAKELEMKFKYEFVSIKNVSHNTHFENPTAFCQAIREFLQ
ncbi:hypothetical protein A9Q84_18320 [Halobacteriovorax marinus]|uniref:2-succinyl-6-hydroxy-2,4-cyclohexadiene-1-carboxylate synthase n=1 Tax=Halobacteriovorax marinus TaxID=97084 RepID=A0A1Y5F337_9BACT|nr:hypothetical protein A9Q84_18320 [Halobacteriovorax marinus]